MATRSQVKIEHLQRLLDSFAPVKKNQSLSCPAERRPDTALAAFSYPGGSRRVIVDIRLSGCLLASNGAGVYRPDNGEGLLAEMNSLVPLPHGQKRGNTGSPRCNSSFDPYKVPRSFLEKCHIKTYPLLAVRRLPDGGKSYIYRAEGAKTVYRIPPPGFDPMKASPKQLEQYGFPPKPSGGPELRQWKRMAENFHFVKPPPYLVKGRATAGGPGYVSASTGGH